MEREREHTDANNAISKDQELLDGLKNCGLLKFFMTLDMKTHTRLLDMLVYYWDIDQGIFIIDHMPLHIKLHDIYFIIGNCRRVEAIDVKGKARGGLNIVDFIVIYYA